MTGDGEAKAKGGQGKPVKSYREQLAEWESKAALGGKEQEAVSALAGRSYQRPLPARSSISRAVSSLECLEMDARWQIASSLLELPPPSPPNQPANPPRTTAGFPPRATARTPTATPESSPPVRL